MRRSTSPPAWARALYRDHRYSVDCETVHPPATGRAGHLCPHDKPRVRDRADRRRGSLRSADAEPVEHSIGSPADHRRGPLPPWRPASCRSPTAVTAADPCASRPRRAGCSGSRRRAPACPMGRPPAKVGPGWRSTGSSPAACATRPPWSTPRTVPTSAPRTTHPHCTPPCSMPSPLRRDGCESPIRRCRSRVILFTPNVVAAIAHTVDLCEQLGHDMVEADPKIDIHRFMRAWTNIVACGTELTVRSRIGRTRPDVATADDIDAVTRGAVALGRTISGSEYLDSVGTVHAIGRQAARLLSGDMGFDMLLTATLAEPPAVIGRFKPDNDDFLDYRMGPNGVLSYSPFTALANGTGQPAMSVPLYWNERRAADRHALHGTVRRRGVAAAAGSPAGRGRPLVRSGAGPVVDGVSALVAALARAIRRSGGRVGGGCLRGGNSRSNCADAWVIVSTARSNGASVAAEVFCTPLILRTN